MGDNGDNNNAKYSVSKYNVLIITKTFDKPYFPTCLKPGPFSQFWIKSESLRTSLAFDFLVDLIFIVKLREREGQRVDLGRSLKGHL